MATLETQIRNVEDNLITSRDRNAADFEDRNRFGQQIGCTDPDQWPIVLIKELLDNACDAAERGPQPRVSVTLNADSFAVEDNGSGIPENKVESLFDTRYYTSSKSWYKIPTRGRLGNALKCVLRAPANYCDHKRGAHLELDTQGRHQNVYWNAGNEPEITPTEPSAVEGTRVCVHWNGVGLLVNDVLPQMVSAFSAVNPHINFEIDLMGKIQRFNDPSTQTQPLKSYRHGNVLWYSRKDFRDLVSHLKATQPQSVREFITKFEGLTRSNKVATVIKHANLEKGARLDELAEIQIDGLLNTMRDDSTEITPTKLCTSLEEPLKQFIERCGVEEGVCYKTSLPSKKMKELTGFNPLYSDKGTEYKVPYRIDIAAGRLPEREDESNILQLCINGSAVPEALQPEELRYRVNEAKISGPVALIMSVVCPNLVFTDKGKGKLFLYDNPEKSNDEFTKAFYYTLKKVLDQLNSDKKKEKKGREQDVTDFCRKEGDGGRMNLVNAYMQASGDGEYGATARQIFYVMRAMWISSGHGPEFVGDDHFNGNVLPQFQEEFKNAEGDDSTKSWKVYYDDRGHYEEPHSGDRMGLGTLSVQTNVNQWDNFATEYNNVDVNLSPLLFTRGPLNRYRYALYIEKEGFDEILKDLRIPEEYDLAIFSSKGNGSVASRTLAAAMEDRGVEVLCVHDYDLDGFKILNTLKYRIRRSIDKGNSIPINVWDLGLDWLTIHDVRWNLQPEKFERSEPNPKRNNDTGDLICGPAKQLESYGGQSYDIEYMFGATPYWKKGETGNKGGKWQGQRVELNAFTTPNFITWLREKLDGLPDITQKNFKVTPDQFVLRQYLQRAAKIQEIEAFMDRVNRKPPEEVSGEKLEAIRTKLEKFLSKQENRHLPWEKAVLKVMED